MSDNRLTPRVSEKAELLRALAARCEQEEPSWDLSVDIELAVTPGAIDRRSWDRLVTVGLGDRAYNPLPYASSIDAAVTLMGERGWGLTWDIESVHAAGIGLPSNIGVCAYVWLDHMTNEKSFVRSPPVETFLRAVEWLPRLICAVALNAMAAAAEDAQSSKLGGEANTTTKELTDG